MKQEYQGRFYGISSFLLVTLLIIEVHASPDKYLKSHVLSLPESHSSSNYLSVPSLPPSPASTTRNQSSSSSRSNSASENFLYSPSSSLSSSQWDSIVIGGDGELTDCSACEKDKNSIQDFKKYSYAIRAIAARLSARPTPHKPMTVSQKMNPLGAHLLTHYYGKKARRGAEYQVYNLNTPTDIPALLSKVRPDELVGFTVVAGRRHSTPVLVKGDQVLMLESLGSKHKVGLNSIAQIALAFNKMKDRKFVFYAPASGRQKDSVSCGTDATQILKEAFKNQEHIFDFYQTLASKDQIILKVSSNSVFKNEVRDDSYFGPEDLAEINQVSGDPGYIAKYSQNLREVSEFTPAVKYYNLNKNNALAHETETVMQYAKRHQKIVHFPKIDRVTRVPEKTVRTWLDKSKNGAIELNKYQTSMMNGAIDKKRNKLEAVVYNLADELDSEQIDELIYETSGLRKVLDSRPLDEVLKDSRLKSIVQKFLSEQKSIDNEHSDGAQPDLNHVSLSDISAANLESK